MGRQIDQYDTSTTPPTPFPNSSHTLVNLFGQYSFDQWMVYGRVENLFADRYEPLIGYGAPGRTFTRLSARARSSGWKKGFKR